MKHATVPVPRYGAFSTPSRTTSSPASRRVMVNYRVHDLHPLPGALRAEGCQVMGKVTEPEYGRFGWVLDPDGNKIELWEPPAGQ